VKLFKGTVLLIEPGRQHLVEHCPAMLEIVASIPAPGVYLLNTEDVRVIESALQSCGIDQAPAIENRRADTDVSSEPGTNPVAAAELASNKPRSFSGGRAGLMNELKEALSAMNVPDEKKRELSKLIDRRLILFPRQLVHHAAIPKEKNEARGFDYVGKVRIIEQTLFRDDLLLEIVTRGGAGKSQSHLVKPIELNKIGNDLVLHCTELPIQEKRKLKVRSMSLVRATRGSLFTAH
jgi:hypothetical protein